MAHRHHLAASVDDHESMGPDKLHDAVGLDYQLHNNHRLQLLHDDVLMVPNTYSCHAHNYLYPNRYYDSLHCHRS